MLDLAHERLDFLRRSFGLLALHVDRGAAVVLVDERQVERGVDDEHDGDQPDEGRHVLEEEAALHSIALAALRPEGRVYRGLAGSVRRNSAASAASRGRS